MIGHLQTNKVADALKIFDVIQSVDSLKLAQTIDKNAQKLDKKIDTLIQVNASGEKQKFGIAETETLTLMSGMAQLKNLNVLGLMTVGPLTDEAEIIRNCFRKLRELRDRVAREFSGVSNISMKFLSMGMSADYRIAIEEGANMVRIGSAIFKNV